MFDQKSIATLYYAHRKTLSSLVALESALNGRFYNMQAAIECMMLAALTGEAMLMIGPPGTAKSRLVRSFCGLVGLIKDEDPATTIRSDGALQKNEKYFEYLLTQFTEPSELFGFYDLGKLFAAEASQRSFERATDGMMQKAEVVFLDEVFNASSAILNSLLTFMNERKFHDRGRVHQTPMRLLFSATNHPPREEGLGAAFDRFLLRCRLDNASADPTSLAQLLAKAWNETHAAPRADSQGDQFKGLLEALDAYRLQVDAMTRAGMKINTDDILFSRLADLVTELRRKDLSQMSNRRLVKFSGVVLAHALLRAARAHSVFPPWIEPRDLMVILNYGLDQEDASTVQTLRTHLLGM